jgi:hypothetical protein
LNASDNNHNPDQDFIASFNTNAEAKKVESLFIFELKDVSEEEYSKDKLGKFVLTNIYERFFYMIYTFVRFFFIVIYFYLFPFLVVLYSLIFAYRQFVQTFKESSS